MISMSTEMYLFKWTFSKAGVAGLRNEKKNSFTFHKENLWLFDMKTFRLWTKYHFFNVLTFFRQASRFLKKYFLPEIYVYEKVTKFLWKRNVWRCSDTTIKKSNDWDFFKISLSIKTWRKNIQIKSAVPFFLTHFALFFPAAKKSFN